VLLVRSQVRNTWIATSAAFSEVYVSITLTS
jgi:hypothetical protein